MMEALYEVYKMTVEDNKEDIIMVYSSLRVLCEILKQKGILNDEEIRVATEVTMKEAMRQLEEKNELQREDRI